MAIKLHLIIIFILTFLSNNISTQSNISEGRETGFLKLFYHYDEVSNIDSFCVTITPAYIEEKILNQQSPNPIQRILYDINKSLLYYVNDEAGVYLVRDANEIPNIDFKIKDTILNTESLKIYSDSKDFSPDGSTSFFKALVKEDESIPKLNVKIIRCIYPGGYATRLINRMKIESVPKVYVDTIFLQRKEWTTEPVSTDFLRLYEKQKFSKAIIKDWNIQKAKEIIMQRQNQ